MTSSAGACGSENMAVNDSRLLAVSGCAATWHRLGVDLVVAGGSRYAVAGVTGAPCGLSPTARGAVWLPPRDWASPTRSSAMRRLRVRPWNDWWRLGLFRRTASRKDARIP